MDQPRPAQRPHRMERHGDVRIDEYYWLNDRENPEVIDYLNAENAFREEGMAASKPLIDCFMRR